MAVEAQNPWNFVFPERNGQDYSFEPQARSRLFIDPSSSSSSSRLLLQQQQHLIIDAHNRNVVSTGLRLSSNDQQPVSEDVGSILKHQTLEIHHLLLSHAEQLRRTISEKNQRHHRALLGAAEELIARSLKEKESEMEKATRRHAELEARAAQLCMEAQAWQAKAKAHEAAAVTLQAQLQQAIITCGGIAEEGIIGRCCGTEGQVEDAESAYEDPDKVMVVSDGGPCCKACRTSAATIVVLPCRHLCLCAGCDQVAQACPLCLRLRNSSVQVFLC